jgi:8-oxo-dGTP pyrophosphatase MutT (NUDIX family)
MVEMTIAPGVNMTAEEIRRSTLFVDWVEKLAANNITLVNPHVSTVLQWGTPIEPKMIFLTTEAKVDGRNIPRTAAFLRGKTVEILPILKCEEEEYVLLVKQLRIPAAQYVVSTPAGMIDSGEAAHFATLRELDEEIDFQLEWSKPHLLIDKPLLVTSGGSDEVASFYYVKANVTSEQIEQLQGHFAGVATEGEQTESIVVTLAKALELSSCVKSRLSIREYQIQKQLAEL